MRILCNLGFGRSLGKVWNGRPRASGIESVKSSIDDLGRFSPLRRLSTASSGDKSIRYTNLSVRNIAWFGIGSGALLLSGGSFYLYQSNEGIRRSAAFWVNVLPIYCHYRWTQFRTRGLPDEEIDEAFDVLHAKYAPTVKKLTLQFRGYYLKVAQLLSTVDHFIPKAYLEWCRQLQNEVPVSLSANEVRQVIRESLGTDVEELFDDFEDIPCGSASVGQVHRAKMKGTEKVVAVKVQGADVERLFRGDVNTIILFCKLAMPFHVKPMEEIKSQLDSEFDFRKEAKNLIDIYDNIMPVFGGSILVPRPVLNACSREVLVMDFIEGETLLKGAKRQLEEYAKLIGRPYEEVEREQLEKIKNQPLANLDKEANKMKCYQAYLSTSTFLNNSFRWCYNNTAGWVFSPLPYKQTPKVINLADIIRLVSFVHGYEILVDGCFNCDPHPGNIILMPNGKIGLLDYGQCKRISSHMRSEFAKLIVALAENNQKRAVEQLRNLGYETKNNNPDVMYRMGQFWHNKNTKDITEGLNPQEFMDYMEAKDPAVDMPGDLVLAGRVSVILRGLGNFFGFDLKMAELWKPIAEEVVSHTSSLRRTLTR